MTTLAARMPVTFCEEVTDPAIIDPTDVIVRIDTTTICGTDLHILKGDVPAVADGRILGQEGVGTVAEIGSAVSTIAFGATDVVNNGASDWIDQVTAMTDGFGVDDAVEAVGVPETFEACTRIVRLGGSVANVGVHGAPVELALPDLWIMDVSITTGLVSTNTTPMLLKLVAQDKLAAASFATHPFTFADMLDACDTFGRAAEAKALKVVVKR